MHHSHAIFLPYSRVPPTVRTSLGGTDSIPFPDQKMDKKKHKEKTLVD